MAPRQRGAIGFRGIHVYGRDLAGLDRCSFNLETGAVSSFVITRFDNE
jgi:hypothetical protein